MVSKVKLCKSPGRAGVTLEAERSAPKFKLSSALSQWKLMEAVQAIKQFELQPSVRRDQAGFGPAQHLRHTRKYRQPRCCTGQAGSETSPGALSWR